MRSTAVHRYLAVAIPFFATAWLVTVPSVLTPASFFAVVGLIVGFGWVAKITYLNSQAPASLAQMLHETERTAPVDRPRDTR